EARLSEHPAVEDVRVVVRDYGEDDRRLVAYVVPSERTAHPVRELARLRRTDPDLLERTCELPDGRTVFHHNKSETDFVYEEIFTDLEYLRHGITIDDGDCVFDVGANIGLFTLFAAGRSRDVSVYAFEPIPPVADSLRRNVELHGLNARVFPHGLSSEAREETFTFYRHNTVISSSRTTTEQAHEMVRSFLRNQERLTDDGAQASDELVGELVDTRLDSERFTCRLRTLSEVVRDHAVERIDLLKIDVENAEYEVLKGIEARDWPRIRQIVMELHDVDDQLEKVTTLLRALGYEVVTEQDNRLLRDIPLHNVYARRPEDGSADPRSGGAATPERDDRTWSAWAGMLDELRDTAREFLPEYMLPAAYVPIDELPLTPNGKLDHRALPDPEHGGAHEERRAPLRTEAQRTVARVWSELLRVEADDLGEDSDFFSLGGNSLLVTRLVNRLARGAGAELAIQDVFDSPTLGGVADLVERSTSPAQEAPDLNIDDIRDGLSLIEGMSEEELEALADGHDQGDES
ncbi:FkbM family methyltransferase, partial [Nocardiopsis halotolerans]|uniref:FkbM family methyltransferase n=1 Tax=Nocardiopsis halotolerans TaxID=124252 RepID=UPI00036A81E7